MIFTGHVICSLNYAPQYFAVDRGHGPWYGQIYGTLRVYTINGSMWSIQNDYLSVYLMKLLISFN